MADGHVETVMTEAAGDVEFEVLRKASATHHPLSEGDLTMLKTDLQTALSVLLAWPASNNFYWKVLPWFLAAGALRNEDQARLRSVEAVAMFDKELPPHL